MSPNHSAENQNILGEVASPDGLVEKPHQENNTVNNNEENNVDGSFTEDVHNNDDKENGPNAAEEQVEENHDSNLEDVLPSSPPKRAAEDHPEGSESETKKARTIDGEETEANNDEEKMVVEDEPTSPALETKTQDESVSIVAETSEAATATTSEETPSSTESTCSRSTTAKELFETLAKAKEIIQQSKETLQDLKEQHQTLVSKEEIMATKIESFDNGLTTLKGIHEENGKDLERVIALRDAANEKFDKAAETLRTIQAKKDQTGDEKAEVPPVTEGSVAVETEESEPTDHAEGVDAGVVVWKREPPSTKNTTNENERVTDNVGDDDVQKETPNADAEIESKGAEAEAIEPGVVVWQRETSKAVDSENAETEGKEAVEDMDVEEEEVVEKKNEPADDTVDSEPATTNLNETVIETETENEETTSQIDGSLAQEFGDDEDPDDTLLESDDEEDDASPAPKIDSTLALELHDENETDVDDSLISM